MADPIYQLPNYPYFLQEQSGDTAITYTASDFRTYTRGMFPQVGIMSALSFRLLQSSPIGWSVKVNAGWAMVDGYMAYNPAAVDISLLSFNTAPTSVRVHRFYVAIYDKLASGNQYAAKIVAREDTGTGATPPTDCTTSLLLGSASISAGQSYIQDNQIANIATHARGGSAFTQITPNSGFVDAAAELPAGLFGYRYSQGRCYLSGSVMRSNGATFATDDYVVANLPAALIPKRCKYFTVACSVNGSSSISGPGTYAALVIVNTDGTVTVKCPPTQSPKYVFFDNVNFDLDN